MSVKFFDINGPALFTPRVFSDDRGNFIEMFKVKEFEAHTGITMPFVQDNQSLSKSKGTIRGLHFQAPPHAQGKLVRCLAGSIIDIAVDVRGNSSTYGQHVRVTLSAENAAQLWVPPGFLHGFSTLENNTVVAYKCTDYYAQAYDGNIHFNDPDLALDWGLDPSKAILSEKDLKAPAFQDFRTPF